MGEPIQRKDGSWTSSEGAARDYSWPPFEEGNLAHTTHGARSPRVVTLAAEQVRRQLVEAVPSVAAPEYAVTLEVLVTAVVRHRLLHDYLVGTSIAEGVGRVGSRTWESANATGRLAMDAAGRFGLSPTDEARLAETAASAEINRADLLRKLTERGKAIRLDAERRGTLAASSDGEPVRDGQEATDNDAGRDGAEPTDEETS